MMQIWLVLLGGLILHEGREVAKATRKNTWPDHFITACFVLGWGCLVLSVILVFVNGGTTG